MIRVITITLGFWLSALISAPYLVQSNYSLLQYFGTAVYFLAEPSCHQLPERSFFLNELPMPVCVRCFSIYLGGFAIFVVALFKQSYQTWSTWIYYVSGSLFLIEFLAEYLNLYHNIFELRLLSGFILGILLFRIILEFILKEKVRLKNG